jgi:ribosome biogenesis protein NSA1
MKVFTGDENGLLKVVESSNPVYTSYGLQSRSVGVAGMSVCRMYNEEGVSQAFSALRVDGSAELWQYDFSESRMLLDSTVSTGLTNPTGIQECPSVGLVAHSEDGKMVVMKKGEDGLEVAASFSTAGPVTASACCQGGGVAIGGRENDLQLYDLNTLKQVWKAKNVANDYLSLRVPVWVADVAFTTPSESLAGATILTGTRHKHVRGYDTRIQDSQKPTFTFEIGGDYGVTAIQPSADGHGVYVGEASGGLFLFDIRTQRRAHTLKPGPVGSIRQLTMSDDGTHLACVGLDRYARIYSTRSHKAVAHVYVFCSIVLPSFSCL